MVDDWVIKTMYATKRRRRNTKCIKVLPGTKDNIKSNPSKRHRERLNSELDHLASLLPFDQSVISKLDKLSILRLAVSYLRMKCYFQSFQSDRALSENRHPSHLYHFPYDLNCSEGDAHLQALNGFVFIVSCDGEVFSASRTVEYYLGFHQSDILHQSVLELIHSEDREEFKRQLSWSALLPADKRNMTFNEVMKIENCHFLQRCFTVRFRCLLDNTSGFITLEISGRLQYLFGQPKNKITDNNNNNPNTKLLEFDQHQSNTNSGATNNLPSLGLFAVCSPFGHLPNLDAAQRDLTFKTKHNLDLSFHIMDVRAKVTLGYTDKEVPSLRVYNLIHQDDLNYLAKGHEEIFKNGTIGLLVHRWRTKSQKWIWLQSSLKIIFKAGKQHAIMATHRQLTQDEGRELYTRRNAEYKLPFPLLEPETLLEEDEEEIQRNFKSSVSHQVSSNASSGGGTNGSTNAGGTKRQRSQLKDYLQASRKRKAPYRDVVQVLPPSCYSAAVNAANFHATYGPLAAAAGLGSLMSHHDSGGMSHHHPHHPHHQISPHHLCGGGGPGGGGVNIGVGPTQPLHQHHPSHNPHHFMNNSYMSSYMNYTTSPYHNQTNASTGSSTSSGGLCDLDSLCNSAVANNASNNSTNTNNMYAYNTSPATSSSTNAVAASVLLGSNTGNNGSGNGSNGTPSNYDVVLSSYYSVPPPQPGQHHQHHNQFHNTLMDMDAIGRVPKLLSPYFTGNPGMIPMPAITTDNALTPDDNNNNLKFDISMTNPNNNNQDSTNHISMTTAAAASLLADSTAATNNNNDPIRRQQQQLYNQLTLSYEQQQQQQQQILLSNFKQEFLSPGKSNSGPVPGMTHKPDFYRCGDVESISVPVVQTLWGHNA